MDLNDVPGINNRQQQQQRRSSPSRRKKGKGKPVHTPKASDVFQFVDDDDDDTTPHPPAAAVAVGTMAMAGAPRKNQNSRHNQKQQHQNQKQHQHQQQHHSFRSRTREEEESDGRFSGGSSDDDNDDKDERYSNNNRKTLLQQPNSSASDIINIDDDDDDDDNGNNTANNASTGRTFDGVPIDGYIDEKQRKYIDDLNRRLGHSSTTNAASTSASAITKNRNYRGAQHGPSSMAQSLLSPHKKGGQRIPRKVRFDSVASRAEKYTVDHHNEDVHPLDVALQHQQQRKQEYSSSSSSRRQQQQQPTLHNALENGQHQQHHHHQHQHRSSSSNTANNNHTSRVGGVGKSYSSRGGNNSNTTFSTNTNASITINATNGGSVIKFGGGSLDSKRRAEPAMRRAAEAEASRRSEMQQQQQQQQQQQNQRKGNIVAGVKRMFDTAIEIVTTPLKKKLNSGSPPEEVDDDAEEEDDYNSTVAVHSVEAHPNRSRRGGGTAGTDGAMDDDDEGYIDCINACSQPLSSEIIHNMTPKYHPPPSTKSGTAGSSGANSSSSSGLWDWNSFGIQKCPTTINKPKMKIADMNLYVRRSKRQSEDAIESSPDDDVYHTRNHNMENNSASYNPQQQQRQQRSQSSKPVASKSTATTTTTTARAGRRKKDPAQRNNIDPKQNTCDNWLAKSRRQGGLIDDTYSDKDDAEFEFEDEYDKSSKKRNNPPTRHPRRTSTRSSPRFTQAKGGNKADEVITIDSSDEGDDTSFATSSPDKHTTGEGRQTRSKVQGTAIGDVPSIDAVRIAIGRKVFKSKCKLSFQPSTKTPYIEFAYEHDNKLREHRVHLDREDMKEVKYHIAPEDDTAEGVEAGDTVTVIAFRITPSDTNSLTQYSKSYNQEEGGKNIAKNYISVEPRNPDALKAMLVSMQDHEMLQAWCTDESEFQFSDLEKYASALLQDNRKEEEERMRSVRVTRSGAARRGIGGRGETKTKTGENKLLLVYPFEVDEAVLSGSAAGLTELGGKLFGLADGPPITETDDDVTGDNKKRPSRTHYVTICEEDKERLQPGQFLNDTLVDFWMRWISRGESRQPHSNVHFFTSHFMTTLKSEGVDAVASWTVNKKINVFEKKLIFIPVNANLHWSLCVVVNPGRIANSFDGEGSYDQERACILFLDSLTMHNKKMYANHIRKWLNSEWKRLGMGKVRNSTIPFDKDVHMPLLAPTIPYQDNGCDCGVFVCRYAYNLFVMRHMDFTLGGITESPPFNSLITHGAAFQFDQASIPRIRKEIASLIDILSKIYLPIRKEQDEAEKRAKAAEKKAKRSAKRNNPDNPEETTMPAPSELDSREEGNMGFDNSAAAAAAEKEDDDGSDEIASLVDSLSEIGVSVRNVQKEPESKVQRNDPTEIVDDKGDNEVERSAADKSDSDDETVLLSTSDVDELDRTTPPESINYDEDNGEEDRSTTV